MSGGDDHGWLTAGGTDSDDIAKRYDDWANDYDTEVTAWDYRAPADSAALLTAAQPEGGRLLDVGCGTGLAGAAMAAAGFGPLTGIDISETSLAGAAARGIYAETRRVDLQDGPFPYADNAFDALCCIGVLTYVADLAPVFAEFARVVRPGGHAVFTQRADLWESRDTETAAAGTDGLTVTHIGEPRLYLPNNADFADKVLVRHVLCRIAG